MTLPDSNFPDKSLLEKIENAGQSHLLRYWSELSESERQKFVEQLQSLDFELIKNLYQQFVQTTPQLSIGSDLEPAGFISLPRTDDERQAFAEARRIGEAALRAGQVAAVLVAGGQATRLGFDAPKGMFRISPIRNKSFFQLYAEQLKALGKRYGAIPPWYIMTSQANHQQTVGFFEENSFFGLSREDVAFFSQGMIPAIDSNGKLFLEKRNRVFTNPNGHGGILPALKQSGALQDMRERGIEILFYFQVDNVLIKICDPVFVGFHLQDDADMSAKIVSKRDADEKVGVLSKRGNRIFTIEYSDLPDSEKFARNPDGTLRFRAGSIAIHAFNRRFIERLTDRDTALPWHVAHKKISFLDENGKTVTPEEPNGYKFETFVFDAFEKAERTVILEVDRKEEFSPVKNATGADSPETARRDMINRFGRWLESAGAPLNRNSDGNYSEVLEISPEYALDADELRQKIPNDISVNPQLYLGD